MPFARQVDHRSRTHVLGDLGPDAIDVQRDIRLLASRLRNTLESLTIGFYTVDHDFQNYSSSPTIMIPDPAAGQTGALGEATMMLMMDPPQHTAFRKLIRAAHDNGGNGPSS